MGTLLNEAEHHPGPGHVSPTTHVALRADGRRLASCSYDGQVLLWEASEQGSLSPLTSLRHGRRVFATDWNPAAADLLATASNDRIAAVWRIMDDRPPMCVALLTLSHEDVRAVIWTTDGRSLVCLTDDGDVTLWDASSATLVGHVGRRRRCVMVSISVGGSVATVSDDDVIAIGDLSPRHPRTLRRYASPVGTCAWSPSGLTLAVARPDGRVELLTAGLDLVAAFDVPASAVRSVAWADDDHLLVGGCDGSLHLLDRDGRLLWHARHARLWPVSMSATYGLVAVASLLGVPQMLRLTRG